jgi:hypothetical protein
VGHEEDHHHRSGRSGFGLRHCSVVCWQLCGQRARAASAAEVQFLASNGIQPGKWVVNGFGIASADGGSANIKPVSLKNAGKTCWYVLDELLCD